MAQKKQKRLSVKLLYQLATMADADRNDKVVILTFIETVENHLRGL